MLKLSQHDILLWCIQMEVELHPYKNELRIKLKPSSTDESLVATLQLVPRLGETKVRALLERFQSKQFVMISTTFYDFITHQSSFGVCHVEVVPVFIEVEDNFDYYFSMFVVFSFIATVKLHINM